MQTPSKKICLNLKNPAEGWWTYKQAAPWFSEQLKKHAKKTAEEAGRPYERGTGKMEEQAAALAETDRITEGLVCVYWAMETCRTCRVRYGQGRPVIGADLRVCLVLYFYVMDPDFGLMHIKVKTWFPFTMQVYVNGHEWLARQLQRKGIGFRKVDNAFVWLEDITAAQRLARRIVRRQWPKLLHRLAARVNPLLSDWLAGPSHRPESLSQRLQPSRLPPNHRQLHRRFGERLLALRRRLQTTRPR